MRDWPLDFTPDDNGTILVTCPLLPEVTTFGVDHADALNHGRDAVEEALAARVARWADVPCPHHEDLAAYYPKGQTTRLPWLAQMKAQLYLAAKETGTSRADLMRRLGWHREQIDRLFRFDHASRVDQIEAAFHALDSRLDLTIGIKEAESA